MHSEADSIWAGNHQHCISWVSDQHCKAYQDMGRPQATAVFYFTNVHTHTHSCTRSSSIQHHFPPSKWRAVMENRRKRVFREQRQKDNTTSVPLHPPSSAPHHLCVLTFVEQNTVTKLTTVGIFLLNRASQWFQ
jgi:hypothetical protein